MKYSSERSLLPAAVVVLASGSPAGPTSQKLGCIEPPVRASWMMLLFPLANRRVWPVFPFGGREDAGGLHRTDRDEKHDNDAFLGSRRKELRNRYGTRTIELFMTNI